MYEDEQEKKKIIGLYGPAFFMGLFSVYLFCKGKISVFGRIGYQFYTCDLSESICSYTIIILIAMSISTAFVTKPMVRCLVLIASHRLGHRVVRHGVGKNSPRHCLPTTGK